MQRREAEQCQFFSPEKTSGEDQDLCRQVSEASPGGCGPENFIRSVCFAWEQTDIEEMSTRDTIAWFYSMIIVQLTSIEKENSEQRPAILENKLRFLRFLKFWLCGSSFVYRVYYR
ncbi:hypothetical protein KQX54_008059 [Cotesia glomerata]|uniref:Uncharacterized protein n=1 Tax=Cotesia glomerata TaxID=32391 RepID=A0AAV7IID3_COTGL|nr:hypothetical protein KQX54_008059 [Cotesia glomerata]